MYDIEEALTAVGAGALVQKRIDPLVNELQRRYSPLVASIPAVQWNSTVFNWDTRTALPSAGPTTDGGTGPVSSSTYVQSNVTIQHLLSVGSVTGYAEAVTQSFGSLRGREINGSIKSINWAAETQIVAGNAAATADGPYPEFDGFDTLCNVTSGVGQNCHAFNTAFDLASLDVVIDMVEENLSETVAGPDYMFVVSSSLESRIAQLLTNQQRFSNIPRAAVAAGLNVMTYRDIPLVKSSYLNAKGGTMPAVTTSTATTGGHIGATTERFYQVSAVIGSYGETIPCAEVNQTTGSGSTNIITLSFTPPTTPDGAPVLLYKVWESSTTGTETLLGYVDGTVGLQSDNVTPIPTTSIVDTGVALVPQNGATVPASSPAAYVGGSGLTPKTATGQDFYLVSRDPANLCRPYVRDCQPVPNLAPTVTSPDQLPYAIVTDTALGLRMPSFIGRGQNVTVTLANCPPDRPVSFGMPAGRGHPRGLTCTSRTNWPRPASASTGPPVRWSRYQTTWQRNWCPSRTADSPLHPRPFRRRRRRPPGSASTPRLRPRTPTPPICSQGTSHGDDHFATGDGCRLHRVRLQR